MRGIELFFAILPVAANSVHIRSDPQSNLTLPSGQSSQTLPSGQSSQTLPHVPDSRGAVGLHVEVLLVAPREEYMFFPIMETLVQAFREEGADVHVSKGEFCEMTSRVRKLNSNKIKPVVVFLNWCSGDWTVSSCSKRSMRYDNFIVQDVRKKLDTHLVLYNPEPTGRLQYDGRVLLDAVRQYKPDEVWDYSHYIMSLYKDKLPQGVRSRYLPPGCADGILSHVALDQKRDTSRPGFLGKWSTRSADSKLFLDEQHLGGALQVKGDARTLGTVKEYLGHSPVLQLNIHSQRNPPGEAMEVFRVGPLIMSGACVISEPVSEMDSSLWTGVVTFANLPAIGPLSKLLLHDEKAMKDCNARAKKNFCEVFQPAKLLEESGFLDDFRQISQSGMPH